jgi:hypothetical protein
MSHERLAEITVQRQEPNASSGASGRAPAPATIVLRGGIQNHLDDLEHALDRVVSPNALSESVVLDAGAAKLAPASRVIPMV